MAFHPARCKTLVFAGDKWGKIGIWDVVRTKSSFYLHFWSYQRDTLQTHWLLGWRRWRPRHLATNWAMQRTRHWSTHWLTRQQKLRPRHLLTHWVMSRPRHWSTNSLTRQQMATPIPLLTNWAISRSRHWSTHWLTSQQKLRARHLPTKDISDLQIWLRLARLGLSRSVSRKLQYLFGSKTGQIFKSKCHSQPTNPFVLLTYSFFVLSSKLLQLAHDYHFFPFTIR